MALEGNLPVNEILKIPVKLQVASLDGAVITADGLAPGVTSNFAFAFLLAPGAVGEIVSACVLGITMCRLTAGLVNFAAGTRMTTAGGGQLQGALAGNYVIGRLVDPIGTTPTVANQMARILITREGNA